MNTLVNNFRQVQPENDRASWSAQMMIRGDDSVPAKLQKALAELKLHKEPSMRFLLANFIEDGQISVNGHNWSIWERALNGFLKAQTPADAKRGLDKFSQELLGHASWEEVTKKQNPKLNKVLKKVMERQLGHVNSLKIMNLKAIYHLAAKVSTDPDPTAEKRKARMESLQKVYPWQAPVAVEWSEIKELVLAFAERFGFKDLSFPSSWTLNQIKQWMWWAAEDLETIAEFLKIHPSNMCPFSLVLAPMSAYGSCSFGIAENTMFLDDQYSFAFMHEWLHYFDWRLGKYLMQVMDEYDVAESPAYWSSLPYEDVHDFLPEGQVLAAGEFMRSFLMSGEMYQKSAALDNRSTEKAKYWTQQHEMVARSFEMWLFTALKGKLKVLLPTVLDSKAYPVGAQQQLNNSFWSRTWPSLAQSYERGLAI